MLIVPGPLVYSLVFTQCPSPCLPAGAVELRTTIGRALGLELPGTLVFDCPTAADIARHISAALAATMAATPQRQATPDVVAAAGRAVRSTGLTTLTCEAVEGLVTAAVRPFLHDLIHALDLLIGGKDVVTQGRTSFMEIMTCVASCDAQSVS